MTIYEALQLTIAFALLIVTIMTTEKK
ncbi:putative holin-like toxin [Tuberibacillus calidus]